MLKVKQKEKYIQIYDPFRNIKYNLSKTSWEMIKLIKKHGKEDVIPEIMKLFNIDEKNAREDVETILNNFKLLKLNFEDVSTEISTSKYAPRRTQFDITTRCNQKCLYCASANLMSHTDVISTEKIIETLKSLYDKGMWILVISGGEPFLREDIFKILDFTNKLDIVTWVYSNGTLIDEKVAKKLVSYKKMLIQISLDSSNPEHNDLQRGVKGSFEKTVNGIKNLIKNGIIPTVAITVTPNNFNDIEKTIDFLYNLGIKQVRLAPASINYGKAEKNKEKLSITPEEIKLLGKKIGKLNEQYDGKMFFSVSPNMFDFPMNPELVKTVEAGCEAGKEVIYISSKGDVYPCYTLGFPEFKAGNVVEQDLFDIWDNSEVFHRFRKLTINDLEECKDCSMANKCFGGCRGTAYAYHRRLTAPDPVYCSFYLDKEFHEEIDRF